MTTPCKDAAHTAPTQREYGHWRASVMPPPAVVTRLRQAARHQADAMRAPMTQFFQTVYGLSLPAHVLTFWAFWLALTPIEREAMKWPLALSPGPLFMRFMRLPSAPPPTIFDPRLDMRFYTDPPEFLTLLFGDGDGLRYGLWYDDPALAPAFIAAIEDGEAPHIRYQGETLLQMVFAEASYTAFTFQHESNLLVDNPCWRSWLICDAIQEFEADAGSERDNNVFARQTANPSGRIATIDGIGAWLPERYPLLGRDVAPITAAICADAPVVQEWVDQALQECAAGAPAQALALGRDLHWLSARQSWREASAQRLLAAAYDRLDRQPLAQIAMLHHRHRGRSSVDVFAGD